MIIDAHVHLWDRQQGMVDHRPVVALTGGRSDFGGEIRQMMPPYMLDGRNTAEMLLANMDYAQVSGCVVTQEAIDGCQDAYLLDCKRQYGDRMRVCCLYQEKPLEDEWVRQFDGIKICGGRLSNPDLMQHEAVFAQADRLDKFISIDLADGTLQTDAMQQLAERFPRLKIAIGHFGMVTVPGWEKQIELARNPQVFIETGGITWLFHQEYYPYPSAIKAIRRAIEICGIHKLMWGSDYPRTMTAITYLMSRDFIEKSAELTEAEKAKLLGENAREFYGFPQLEVPPRIRNMVE